jgi:hypothetical protein
MSTGPDHYREAERLTESADRWLNADAGWMASMSAEERLARRASDLDAAQVHATLALAAATAMQPSGYGYGQPEFKAWDAVAGVQPEAAKGGDAR